MFDFPKQVIVRIPTRNDSERLAEFLNSETEVTWGTGDPPSTDPSNSGYISPSHKAAVRIYNGKSMWRGDISFYRENQKYADETDPEWFLISVDEFISKITGVDSKVQLEIGDLI